MADVGLSTSPVSPSQQTVRRASWVTRLVASPRFQSWAARFPLTRRIVRREGDAMFDLVAGFCHSQILQALVKLGIPDMLRTAQLDETALARAAAVPLARMRVLLAGGVAIGVLKQGRHGDYGLTVRGAALAGVPGLAGMIAHHDVLYRDLADPVAFFRGEVETELAAFWPYVFGAGAAADPDAAATYSQLMADSQTLVAADTLALADFGQTRSFMDVGGGTGAFLAAVGQQYPALALTLFDLPAVVDAAHDRFDALRMADRLTVLSGSFRDDPLPAGHDMISLVRVLYDHDDATVLSLLGAVFKALPVGGRLLVSEPMTGGASPQKAGDAYFALYCLAMRTGKARSPAEIAALMAQAGFAQISAPRSRRPFITTVLQGVRQS
ncbi:methyltransferase [Yoonia sp. SS1-5]|uniref:Methyltransferase n=1 Tax=Yoonia rhodophyticola TaxID=3137370 RepID=A0AAN0NLY9_9RHOB